MAWFPITDPSRDDDIRMRRRRALLLLGSIAFVPWMLWGDHHAARSPSRLHGRIVPSATRNQDGGLSSLRIAADTLRIDLPCPGEVTVLPDPTLSGRAILSAPAGVLDSLIISGGVITGRGACDDDSPITIRTGTVMPLFLVQSGENALHAGRFDAAVTVDSRGDGTVSLDHAGSLTVRGESSGDVTVGSVTGPVTATMNGSGDLRIEGGTIPVLEAASWRSGDLMLDQVQVLGGRVTLEGSGNLQLGGSAGSFEADTRGSGDISIGTVNNDRLTLRGDGSGNIKVGDGHVAFLQAIRRGSGDLAIAAAIDGGRLEQQGDAAVTIPHGSALVRGDR